eukprot:GHVR01055889.1.p1 GENE.GHVR01055889.1~~GHVR01055889.1.p1  ORF type:complete len:343 (+),score=56.13 GHVR01055889.1:27-1055(+)
MAVSAPVGLWVVVSIWTLFVTLLVVEREVAITRMTDELNTSHLLIQPKINIIDVISKSINNIIDEIKIIDSNIYKNRNKLKSQYTLITKNNTKLISMYQKDNKHINEKYNSIRIFKKSKYMHVHEKAHDEEMKFQALYGVLLSHDYVQKVHLEHIRKSIKSSDRDNVINTLNNNLLNITNKLATLKDSISAAYSMVSTFQAYDFSNGNKGIMHIISEMGLFRLLSQLLDHVPSEFINITSHTDGKTPLHYASRGNTFTVISLLRHNARLHVYDKNFDTPLHIACLGDSGDVIRFLLSHEYIEVNILNKYSQTPLDICNSLGKEDFVKILRGHGGLYAKENGV